MLAEADDAGDPATLRRLREACEMSVVAVGDRGAAGFDTVEDLGLGIGDRLERGEIAEMRDLDRGDDGDMRPGDRAELGELAGMVHAELEDAEIRLARHCGRRQGPAPLIVEAADRGVGQALARQRNPQRLLGPGLADAPSDADDPGMAAPPRRAAERRQGGQRIADDEQRRIASDAVGRLCDERRGSPPRERVGDEGVAIEIRPLERDEEVAGGDGAAVDRHAGDGEVAACRAAGCRDEVAGGPQRAHGLICAKAATISRATVASSKGWTVSPTIWPVSWPLPAITRRSPLASSAMAVSIAERRSPISMASGQAARMAARTISGRSLRGLSSVTMTLSARR